jgi:hypothetical protein
MATNRVSPKKGKVVDIPDATITIGTPTAGDSQVSVAFTVATTPATGGPVQKYTAISSPGSFTGSASTSPVVVSGLTNGTAYTFTVAAANATGNGVFSSASASATPLGLSYESIATVSLSSGNQSTVGFSSIPSTYKHLQLRLISKDNRVATGDSIQIRLNGDTGSNYSYHGIVGNGSTTDISALASTTAFEFYRSAGNSGTTNVFGAMVLDIIDYTNTNKNKTVKALAGADWNGGGEIWLNSGAWYSTSAVNSITLIPTNGSAFLMYSHFALYGIKG